MNWLVRLMMVAALAAGMWPSTAMGLEFGNVTGPPGSGDLVPNPGFKVVGVSAELQVVTLSSGDFCQAVLVMAWEEVPDAVRYRAIATLDIAIGTFDEYVTHDVHGPPGDDVGAGGAVAPAGTHWDAFGRGVALGGRRPHPVRVPRDFRRAIQQTRESRRRSR